MIGRPKFVLASGSPRRLGLINQAGIDPDALRPADIDETPKRGELPRACANRLARAKAESLRELEPTAVLLGSDQVVAIDDRGMGQSPALPGGAPSSARVLGKPGTVERAAAQLEALAGRTHLLVTAVALIAGLHSTFAATGNPLGIVVLRKGVTAELNSSITQDAYERMRTLPDVAKVADGPRRGEPMVSPELISVVNLPSVDNPAGMNVTVRGMLPIGADLRDLRLIAGEWFGPGQRQVVVARRENRGLHLGG